MTMEQNEIPPGMAASWRRVGGCTAAAAPVLDKNELGGYAAGLFLKDAVITHVKQRESRRFSK